MSRFTAVHRVALILASAAAVIGLVPGAASAEPVTDLPADTTQLRTLASEVSPAATQAVDQLLRAGILVPGNVVELGLTTPQDFLYPSPTLGCQVGDKPVTVTLASAQAGPNLLPQIAANHLRFQAIPAYLAIPQSADLSVAWINLSTFDTGITALDDRLPILNTPLLSKTVDTGKGTVLATLFGTVGYADGVTCTVVPTVGSFTA